MNHQDVLFQTPSLLEWLPDETFFSLVSRQHRLWGHSVARRTAEQLFGHLQGGAHHDFPSYLGQYVARTGGAHGSAETLALERTLLKYYAAFIPSVDVGNAVAVMTSKNVAHLKLKLGILTSRFRANHPLKACEACIADDTHIQGWAYWHLEHQYPGVWICLKHGQLLRESVFKSSGVERFQWHLPSTDCLRHWPTEMLSTVKETKTVLTDFSRLVVGVVNCVNLAPINSSRLHELYRDELLRRRWLTSGGSLRMNVISQSYLQNVLPLRVLPELISVPETPESAAVQLGRILRTPRGSTHPLRHLLIINWLFGTPDEFWTAYRSMPGHATAPITAIEIGKPSQADEVVAQDPRLETLTRLLSEDGKSFRAASLAVGVDVATAMAWASKMGIQTGRRPKKLKPELRKTIVAQLTLGAHKQAVADNAGLSVGTITRFLVTEVGLHAKWTLAREDLARASARQAWQVALKAHGEAGIKFIRALEPRAYAWLYRNDRAWLDSRKPPSLVVGNAASTTRVAWDARDEVLSRLVREAALELQRFNIGKKLKLWQIYQAIPELKAKLNALKRLPLTREAIDSALRPMPLTANLHLFD